MVNCVPSGRLTEYKIRSVAFQKTLPILPSVLNIYCKAHFKLLIEDTLTLPKTEVQIYTRKKKKSLETNWILMKKKMYNLLPSKILMKIYVSVFRGDFILHLLSESAVHLKSFFCPDQTEFPVIKKNLWFWTILFTKYLVWDNSNGIISSGVIYSRLVSSKRPLRWGLKIFNPLKLTYIRCSYASYSCF